MSGDRFCLPVAVALICLAGATQAVAGAEGEDSSKEQPLFFRRVFVPEPLLPSLAGGHMPLERAEFEQKRSVINAQAMTRTAQSTAQVIQAGYFARLNDDRLVEGTAALQIQHTARSASLLLLEPCGLAVTDPVWQDEHDDFARPATVGVSAAGELVALVERSSQLQFAWTLQGRRDPVGDLSFVLALPSCPTTRVVLALPTGLAPDVDRGIVSRLAAVSPSGTSSPNEQLRSDTRAEEGFISWVLELPGTTTANLRIVPEAALRQKRRLILLKQDTHYDFSRSGVEVSFDLHLDIHHEPIRQLTVELDPSLELTTVRIHDEALTWSLPRRVGGASLPVVVEFPEPLQGTDRVVRLVATAPLETGKPWRLPGIRVRDVAWREGTARLNLPESLELKRLSLTACRETRAAPPPLDFAESHLLQYYSADAAVETEIDYRRAQLHVESGTTVTWAPGVLAGQVVADLTASRGTSFVLDASIPWPWFIESMETEPADALDDFEIDYDSPPSASGHLPLRIWLARAVAPNRVVRIKARLRRSAPARGTLLPGKELRLLRFVQAEDTRALVSVRAMPPDQARLIHDADVQRIDPQQLSTEDVDRLEYGNVGIVFVDDSALDQLKISLTGERPVYQARIRVDVLVESSSVVESYDIQCDPQTTGVSRLLVHLSRARNEAMRWNVLGEQSAALSARRLSPREQNDMGIGGGETWEVVLRQPRAAAFVVRGSRTVPLAGKLPISLAFLPQSDSQSGTLAIRAREAIAVAIEESGLSPRPVPAIPPNQSSTLRAMFNYEPAREADVWVSRAVEPDQSDAWVSLLRVTSQFSVDGEALHQAVFFIENSGVPQARIRLPEGATLERVLVNDAETSVPRTATGGQTDVPVFLPPGARFPMLQLFYRTGGDSLQVTRAASARMPEIDMPVLACRWKAWLPPGYAAFSGAADGQIAGSGDWKKRLFGFLWRSPAHRPFHVLSGDDWWQLLEECNMSLRVLPRRPDTTFADPASPGETSGQSLPFTPNAIPAADVELAGGWAAVELEASPGDPLAVNVYRPAVVRSIAWAAMLIGAGLVGILAIGKPRRVIPILGILCLLSLAVPHELVPITSSLVLAGFAAAVWLLVRRRSAVPAAAPGNDSSISRLAVVSRIVPLVLLLTAFLGAATGGRAAEESEGVAPPVYQVLTPVDDEQQPLGAYDFLPEAFYNELFRRAAAAQAEPRQWLVESVKYQGNWSVSGSKPQLENVSAIFELEVFEADQQIELPLIRSQLTTLNATLDEQPVGHEWMADGDGLVIAVAEAGSHRLELLAQPVVQQAGDSMAFEMTIPRNPRSVLRTQFPGGGQGVQFPTAVGATTVSRDSGELVTDLGPTDRLVVVWPADSAVRPREAETDVEQLLWLQVRPESVIVDATLKFNVLEGEVGEVRLLADPRLRMLPLPDGQSVVGQPRVIDGRVKTIVLDVGKRPFLHEPFVVRASFFLAGTSGIGQLVLPRLEAAADHTSRKWLAVNVAPELEVVTAPAANVAGADFLAAWGSAESTPQLAYRLDADDASWTLATRPRRPQTTADLQLDVSVGSEQMELLVQARMNTVEGVVFQQRLMLPPGLHVQSATLLGSDMQREVRTAHDSAGGTNVFYDREISGDYRLLIRGSLPVSPAPGIELARVDLDVDSVTSRRIRIYRRPEVRVTVATHTGFEPVDSGSVGEYQEGQGRLVASFQSDSATDTPVLILDIMRNAPRVTGQLVTALERRGDNWFAELRGNLSVEDGVLDVLRFDIPSTWSGPFELEPPALHQVMRLPDQSRSQLLIRPPAHITGAYSLRIRGSLAAAADNRDRAVDIRLRDADSVVRYLLLPSYAEHQQLEWDTGGLQATSLAQLQSAAPADRRYEAYQIVGQRIRAMIDKVRSPAGRPAVRLADIHVAAQPHGKYHGVATFDLEPAGASICIVTLPRSCQLVHMSLDELPAVFTRLAAQKWQVRLGSDQLPQRLAVLFRGRLPETGEGHTHRFDAPALADLPVEQTLWTVYSSSADPGTLRNAASASSVTAIEQEQLRLSSIAALIENASDVVAESPPDEKYDWFLPWARRYAAARKNVTPSAAAGRRSPVASGSSSYLVDELEARQASIASRLDLEELRDQVNSDARDTLGHAEHWVRTQPDAVAALRCAFREARPSLELYHGGQESTSFRQRLFAAVAVLLLCVMSYHLLSQTALLDWFLEFPFALVVLLGLAWWMWLAPSILGMLIVLVGIVGTLRSLRWDDVPRTARLRTAASDNRPRSGAGKR